MDNTEQNNPQGVPSQMNTPETQNPQPMQPTPSQKSSWGPVIGLIIILILIIAGSLYFLMQNEGDNLETTGNVEADLENLGNQSSSDELGAIEADLEATNLDNIDAEIDLIEQEL